MGNKALQSHTNRVAQLTFPDTVGMQALPHGSFSAKARRCAVERGRFRQGLRSNPQGLALAGSLARLCFDCFGGKTGGVRVVAAVYSLRVEGGSVSRIAAQSAAARFGSTVQMIRRRVVLLRITKPFWYTWLSAEAIMCEGMDISGPNFRW